MYNVPIWLLLPVVGGIAYLVSRFRVDEIVIKIKRRRG
jgi:hypothetical protein